MKAPLILLALALGVIGSTAAEFARSTSFKTVASFVSTARAFTPATSASDFAALFSVPEPGQPEDPKTATPVAAKAIQAAEELWADHSHALVFVNAAPPTEATPSAVGVLFLLTHQDDAWQVADVLRFSSLGKYAGVSAELTAHAGSGYELGREGMAPVITVKSSHGGRGYSYQLSASFSITSGKLNRLELQ